MKIAMIPKDQVPTVWREVELMIAKALPYAKGRYSIADIYIDLLRGNQSLWVAFDDKAHIYGAVTVRIVQYPNFRALRLETLGGHSVRRWLREGFAAMNAYAKTMECQKIEAFGRKEWGRFFARLGLKPFAIQYEFDLE
jgi:hypothetical protein